MRRQTVASPESTGHEGAWDRIACRRRDAVAGSFIHFGARPGGPSGTALKITGEYQRSKQHHSAAPCDGRSPRRGRGRGTKESGTVLRVDGGMSLPGFSSILGRGPEGHQGLLSLLSFGELCFESSPSTLAPDLCRCAPPDDEFLESRRLCPRTFRRFPGPVAPFRGASRGVRRTRTLATVACAPRRPRRSGLYPS